jgi:hypothetical protein
MWLDAGSPPAEDGEVGGSPARRTTRPMAPAPGPHGHTGRCWGLRVRAPDVHMGPSGTWGVPGVLNSVYKQQKTPTEYNAGHLITVWTRRITPTPN